MAIRRELAKKLVGLGLQEENRLAVCRRALGRENPEISLGFRINLHVDDEAPVPRPLTGLIDKAIRQQRLILPAAAGGFLIEIIDAGSIRLEDDAIAPGRSKSIDVG
jgi:hypothetical protein